MFFRFNIKPKIPIKNKNNDKFIVLSYYKPFGTGIKCLIFIYFLFFNKYYLLITKQIDILFSGFVIFFLGKYSFLIKGVKNFKNNEN
jgi:hypothetical protein